MKEKLGVYATKLLFFTINGVVLKAMACILAMSSLKVRQEPTQVEQLTVPHSKGRSLRTNICLNV